jgi:hypothetical protein
MVSESPLKLLLNKIKKDTERKKGEEKERTEICSH